MLLVPSGPIRTRKRVIVYLLLRWNVSTNVELSLMRWLLNGFVFDCTRLNELVLGAVPRGDIFSLDRIGLQPLPGRILSNTDRSEHLHIVSGWN